MAVPTRRVRRRGGSGRITSSARRDGQRDVQKRHALRFVPGTAVCVAASHFKCKVERARPNPRRSTAARTASPALSRPAPRWRFKLKPAAMDDDLSMTARIRPVRCAGAAIRRRCRRAAARDNRRLRRRQAPGTCRCASPARGTSSARRGPGCPIPWCCRRNW